LSRVAVGDCRGQLVATEGVETKESTRLRRRDRTGKPTLRDLASSRPDEDSA